MADREFTVTHPKARLPLTIRGKTLEDALDRECLDPAIWKLVEPPPVPEDLEPANP